MLMSGQVIQYYKTAMEIKLQEHNSVQEGNNYKKYK